MKVIPPSRGTAVPTMPLNLAGKGPVGMNVMSSDFWLVSGVKFTGTPNSGSFPFASICGVKIGVEEEAGEAFITPNVVAGVFGTGADVATAVAVV